MARVMLLIAAIVLAPQVVRAQTCSDEIALFAQQYGLQADLPRAAPRSGSEPPASGSLGVPTQDLSRSGGVIAPPDGARGQVIEPPREVDPKMATPEEQLQTGTGEATGDKTQLNAAKRAQMQSLLDAARDAERRGDATECLERLSRARAIPEPG